MYLKDKIEREVRDIVSKDIQNGASPGEVNISATCNELIRFGLLFYKNRENGEDKFDLEGYRRDLLRKAAGSREGVVLISTLVAEMYVKMMGKEGEGSLEDTLDLLLSGINTAEDEAEQHQKVAAFSIKSRISKQKNFKFALANGGLLAALIIATIPRSPVVLIYCPHRMLP
ncbi:MULTISPECIES: relaxosome protein TraM [Cronobacter]|uniref:relaxosome protein TraM n=1 Tax=Cronobacter sakazakii TaxID=28141 RepID=UPI003F8814E0